MIVSKECFIIIDKQEDLPTEEEMKGRLQAVELEELVMSNGDRIITNKMFPKGDFYLIKKNVKY